MHRVIIRGCRTGLHKVALEHLLLDRARMPVKQAKVCVDQVVDGQEVIVEARDRETASALAEAISAIGAFCRVDEAAFVR